MLKMAEHVKKVIQPKLISPVSPDGPMRNFEDFHVVNAGHYVNKDVERTDLLMRPYPMVNLKMKDLLVSMEPTLTTRALQLLSDDKKHVPALYFILNPQRVDCLSGTVRINPNGSVDKIILDKEKLPELKVFMPEGIVERRIIVSTDVAEQLLYEGYYGLGLEKVSMI